MREIVLQPGTSIEIDGVVVRAAEPARTSFGCAPMVYDRETGQLTPVVAESALEEGKSRGKSSPGEALQATNSHRQDP